MSGRRRRALVTLSLALACGGLAASHVRGRERALDAQVGPLVPVLVARGEVAPGTRIGASRAARLFAVRQVPRRFAPPDALASAAEAAGHTTAAALGAGSYVTAGALTSETGGGGRDGAPLRAGERALEIAVTGGESLSTLGPGARVDALVTSDSRSGAGRTFVALENAELLAARPGDAAAASGAGAESPGPVTIATLRVSRRQAVYLTAAQSFAREIRLLARPPGDRGRGGALEVRAGDL